VAVVVEYLERSADINASERPALDQLFSDARQKEFDTVVVYSLGRFGRSARDLFLNIATLDKLGIEVFVPSIFVDKSNRTPMGKLIMQIFLAFQRLDVSSEFRSRRCVQLWRVCRKPQSNCTHNRRARHRGGPTARITARRWGSALRRCICRSRGCAENSEYCPRELTAISKFSLFGQRTKMCDPVPLS
jgi:hypothetical protein